MSGRTIARPEKTAMRGAVSFPLLARKNEPAAPPGEDAGGAWVPGFGHDFSQLRVHTDARGEEAAEAVQARTDAARGDIVPQAGVVDTVDRKEDPEPETAEAAQSNPVPGLTTRGVVDAIKAAIRARNYQGAIDLTVRDLAASGQINTALLDRKRMYYDPSLPGEGGTNPPGYYANEDARPTHVGIGLAAFSGGVSWLYSSMMHEYQHVLQFQLSKDSPSRVPGQGTGPQHRHQAEVEAYAWEILNAKKTGIRRSEIEDVWKRLHFEHWVKLSRKNKAPLRPLYRGASQIIRSIRRGH